MTSPSGSAPVIVPPSVPAARCDGCSERDALACCEVCGALVCERCSVPSRMLGRGGAVYELVLCDRCLALHLEGRALVVDGRSVEHEAWGLPAALLGALLLPFGLALPSPWGALALVVSGLLGAVGLVSGAAFHARAARGLAGPRALHAARHAMFCAVCTMIAAGVLFWFDRLLVYAGPPGAP